jgi:hypothetical protein
VAAGELPYYVSPETIQEIDQRFGHLTTKPPPRQHEPLTVATYLETAQKVLDGASKQAAKDAETKAFAVLTVAAELFLGRAPIDADDLLAPYARGPNPDIILDAKSEIRRRRREARDAKRIK